MFLFNKRDVYIGYSMADLSKVRDCLEGEGIRYRYKVIDHAGFGSSRDRIGSFGINPDYQYQYVVSVRESDYEKARWLVNGVLHPVQK